MAQHRPVDVVAPGGPEPLGFVRELLESGEPLLGRLLIVDEDHAAGLEELARSDRRLVLVQCPTGSGWAGRVGAALAERRGDTILLAPGAVPTPGWIEHLARAARAAERVALVASLSDGDGFDQPAGIGEDRLSAAIAGLPDAIEVHRAGLAANYLRGEALDAVGPPDASIADPREAMDDWLARAFALGFFALRACRSLVLGGSGGSTTPGSAPVEGPATQRRDLMRRRIERHERTLDASLARHAVEVATTGRIKVALDLRHLPLEMNGTKMYALSLGKALAKLPEVELSMLAFHPLQAEGVDGRLVHPDAWEDDVHIIHKPAQVFDPAHARLMFESRAHVAVTHQDLIAYRMAEAFNDESVFNDHRQLSRLVLPAMQAILTPSANTADEVEFEFESIVDPDVVHPVHEGGDLEEFGLSTFDAEADEVLGRLGISGPFFMSMASDYPHKNIPALLDAYEKFRESRSGRETPSLVLPGRAPRIRAAASTQTGGPIPGVRFLGAVSHQELRILYQNALALVFPSLYEGFGLPPLEAMAAGTPVAAMPFTSVHEVCRDAALFAEGLAPADLARAMERMADEPNLRRDLRESGYRRVRELTWEKVARETVAVYRRTILNPSARSLQARRAFSEAIILKATPAPIPTPSTEPEIVAPARPAEIIGARQPSDCVASTSPALHAPEPMGVLNACQALRQALGIRLRRDLARVAPVQYARLARAKRLSSRFIQVVRADGFGAAASKASRKLENRARKVVRKLIPSRFASGSTCPYFNPPEPLHSYDSWLMVNAPSPARARRLAEEVDRLARRPKFSILTPVFNTPPGLLDDAVRSVIAQSYENWEMILADDASTDPGTVSLLAGEPWADPRVRVATRSANGNISAATNTAAEHATGDWFVLLDHDDLLHPEALARLAIALDREPDAELIYSDDDKVDLAGARFDPQFKPGWSPELLLSFCYTGHVSAVRAELYREVGGMRLGFEGSQDHDFWLRASEKARAVAHAPQVLYHWRAAPGSTAVDGREKPLSFDAGRRAVEEAFARRGVPCRVERHDWAKAAGCGFFRPAMPDDGPEVAVIVVATDRAKLSRCLASLAMASYRNYRVYVVDVAGTLPLCDVSPHTLLHVPMDGERADIAAIRNRAAEQVDSDLILFLDDDVEATDRRWLSQMVGWSRLPGVGAVGARLMDTARKVLSGGIVHGLNEGLPGDAFAGSPWWDGGPMNFGRVTRNVHAASAACLLVPRPLFLEVGGFGGEDFGTALSESDFGWRLRDTGRRCILCAEAELIRREGDGPAPVDLPRAEASYRRIHGRRRDAYNSPHHAPGSVAYTLRPTVVPASDAGRPVRLAAFTHNLNWEGGSRFELELAVGLKESGAAMPVVFSPTDGPLRGEYERAGVPIHIDPALSAVHGGEAEYVQSRARAVDMIRREGFEVVHANTIQGFWAVDAARESGTPSIWSLHESEPWSTCFDHLAREIARTALDCFESPYRVVFTARSTAGLWSPLDTRGNFDLVRYALNLDRFRSELDALPREMARMELSLKDDEVCVLLLGTVCDRKGQHDLAHAFREIAPDVAARMRCVVVGARDSLEYSRGLKQLAAGLPEDRRDRFHVVDETGDTAIYWQAADVFCCTSRVESYPHVILEAMGRTLPIVTTPVHGIPEQVRRDVNALFYRPGDVRSLANALEAMVRDEKRRREMGEASSQVLRALPNHADMIDRYSRLVREAAESASPMGARQSAAALYRGVHFANSTVRSISAG